jgi:hypothetical protein
MRLLAHPKLGEHRFYTCPRCNDSYPCATADDLLDLATHRLLHLASDWKRSYGPAPSCVTGARGPGNTRSRHRRGPALNATTALRNEFDTFPAPSGIRLFIAPLLMSLRWASY